MADQNHPSGQTREEFITQKVKDEGVSTTEAERQYDQMEREEPDEGATKPKK